MAKKKISSQAAIAEKALELSGLDAEAFEALADEEKQAYIKHAAIALSADVEEENLLDHPSKITLTCPFAFYDDDERLHSWQAGQIVEDQADIAVLIAAGAEHTIAE